MQIHSSEQVVMRLNIVMLSCLAFDTFPFLFLLLFETAWEAVVKVNNQTEVTGEISL